MDAQMEALRARFAAELHERLIRLAQARDPKVPALTSCSIRTITEARSLFSANVHSFDQSLPPPLLDEMMLSPETRAMRSEPEHLRLLLSASSRCCGIYIPYSSTRSDQQDPHVPYTAAELECFKQKLETTADLVLGTGTAKDSVRTLALELGDNNQNADPAWTTLVRDFLHRLLEGLSDLIELSLLDLRSSPSTGLLVQKFDVVNDETMMILARRHTSLKKLAVQSHCIWRFDISELGLRHLASHCTQLVDLDLSGMFFYGISTGAYAAFLTPTLETLITCLSTEHVTVANAIYDYAMQDPQPPPLPVYTKVTFNDFEFSNDYNLRPPLRDRDDVLKVFAAIPNVTKAHVRMANEEICIGLCEIANKFETLELQLTGAVTTDTQRRLMEKVAPSITTLSITAVPGQGVTWDLGLVAEHCLGLEDLYLNVIIAGVGEDFEVKSQQFAKLAICALHHRGNNVLTLPGQFFLQMCSSPRLKRLILYGVRAPDHVLWELCGLAGVDRRGVLSSLELLVLDMWIPITVELAIALVCAAPRLNSAVPLSGALHDSENAMFLEFCRRFL